MSLCPMVGGVLLYETQLLAAGVHNESFGVKGCYKTCM